MRFFVKTEKKMFLKLHSKYILCYRSPFKKYGNIFSANNCEFYLFFFILSAIFAKKKANRNFARLKKKSS